MLIHQKRKTATLKMVEKACHLMENALQSDENAFAFRNTLFEMYGNNRESLYTSFYREYRILFGAGMDPSDIHSKDSDCLFRLDHNMATALERSLPEALRKKYDALQSQMLERSLENDQDPRYDDFYELMFSGFHFDLLYLSGLMIKQNE